MKTKLVSALLLSLTISLFGYSQQVSNINFDEIKSHIQDPTSSYYYPYLEDRILQNDTTLTYEDYKHLYYGNAYSENYDPYGSSATEKEFNDLYSKELFSEAIPIGKNVLQENPINLKTLYRMLVCYHVLEMKDSARLYANHYFAMLDVIYTSGDGKSIATAYVVLKVNDEYQILSDKGLRSAGQALLNGPTDRLTIDKKSQKKVKGQQKIKELYFNVSKPFEYLDGQFKD